MKDIMTKLTLKLIGIWLSLMCLIFSACDNSIISEYPIHLADSKDISNEFVTFNFQPRMLIPNEIISLGINLKGLTLCYDRKEEFRICSQQLRDSRPKFNLPDELKFDPNKQYTEEERKVYRAKLEALDEEFTRNYREPWLKKMDELPMIDLEVIAIDSTGKEYPFIYIGSGAGYCGNENDQLCNQYNFDKKINDNFTENPLVALKIRNKQAADIQISNCYIVEKYKRD